MLLTLAARGDRRPCYLFFGTRRVADAAYYDEILELRAHLNLTVTLVVSAPPSDWTGERGYVDAETLRRHLPADRQALQFFICGPGAMQDAMEDTLHELGVAGERVHTERFNFV